MALLFEEGACFTVGSDAHDIPELEKITTAWNLVDRLGIPNERLWRPADKPVKCSQ